MEKLELKHLNRALRNFLGFGTLKYILFIRNNITRYLNTLGINKTDISYFSLSNISAFLCKSHFQSKIKLKLKREK